MVLPLAPHVHLAVLGEDVVFLDVTADAYLCVPGGLDALSPTPDRSALQVEDAETIKILTNSGLLGPDGEPRARALPARPCRDLPAGAAPSDFADGLRLALAYCDYLIHYRGRAFAAVLDYAGGRMPSSAADSAEILRLAMVFDRWAVWLPLPSKCLARSFVLLRFLQRSGQAAQWVFGVRTWPFAAHCWLQLEEVVLDDFAERLAPYEPILAIA